jgi:hypothetical protein
MLALIGLLATAALNGVAAGQGDRDDTPNFVFSGTVQKLEASNVPHIKASNRTAIVTVDEVQSDLPRALAGVKGQQVTVELSKPLADAPLQVGQKVVFSTQGHVYGETIAVREVGDRGAAPQVKPKAAAAAPDPALKKQLAQAAAVVTGTVEEVRPVSAARIMAAAGKAAGPRRPISEHDPKWHAAIIKVDSVEKGAPGAQRVVVCYPESRDIAWRRAPKYSKNQKGTWLLQKQQIANPELRTHLMTAAATVANAEVQHTYTALDPKDFIPAHDNAGTQLEQIRTMIREKP